MRQLIAIAFVSVFGVSSSSGQTIRAVVNAASLAVPGLPGSGVAQGSQFAILGADLGPPEELKAAGFPYPTTDGLGGVTVKVTSGGSTADAIMVSVSATKVVAVLPSSLGVGTGQVSLTVNSTTVTAPVEIVAAAFGIFTRNSLGSGPGIVSNLSDDGSSADNSVDLPAKPQQRVSLSGTGLGAVTGDEAGGPITGDIATEIELYVGGKKVDAVSKGRSECCAGVDRIVFTVPDGVSGCYVPVAVRIGTRVSNFATMSISDAPGCPDAGFTPEDLEKFRVSGSYSGGSVIFSRGTVAASGFEIGSESVSAAFAQTKFDGFILSQAFNGRPSIGSCIVTLFSDFSNVNVETRILDAGATIAVSGPSLNGTMTKQEGVYTLTFPPVLPGVPAPANLPPGDYTATGTGGADIGPFTAKITLGAQLVWTNRATTGNAGPDTINRGADVTVNWTGGTDANIVLITGSTSQQNPRVTASFTCLERAPVGTFTIPSWVLSAIPPSQQGFLSLNTSDSTTFTAPGVDNPQVISSSSSGRLIAYR